MKNFENIEDLFKDNLSGFEADPGAGVWESISQNLASQQAAAGSAAAGTGAASKVVLAKWIVGVAIVSTGIGITAGYFYSENKHENKENKEQVEVKGTDAETSSASTEENVVLTENTTEIHAPQTEELHTDKVVIRDEKKQKTIIVSVQEKSDYSKYKSVSDKWITKNNVFAYSSTNNNTTNNNTENTSAQNSSVSTVSVVKEEDIHMPVAVIMRSTDGGTAPLTVMFSSQEKADTYQWIFSDAEEVATSQGVSHTFETPGEHSVILVVKDKKGNTVKDEIKITVAEATKAEKPVSKFSFINPNIFTPNNDGDNDVLEIAEHENLESFIFQVLDRNTGKVYFQTTDPDFKWDGTMMNGEKLPDGNYIYFYKAIGKDDVKYIDNSTITIKR